MARIVNCNYYTVVPTREEADVVIVPFKVDGKHSPEICLRSKRKKDEVLDTNEAEWIIGVRIATNGTRADYNQRVKWWFDSVNAEYKEMVNTKFGVVLPNIKNVILEAQGWLYKCQKSQRKSDVGSFMERWLNRECRKTYIRGA